MASTSTQIASSSSSSIPRCTFDAFLSFRGEDTRNSFTDHLHDALKRKGIRVFRDDEKLERGKIVGDELLKVIQESRYAIVVISANYASSRWCLIELVEILECMRGPDMRVLPVFYHVDPSDVRNQIGTFAEAFAKHEKIPKFDDDKLQNWRAALKEVGNISGWHVDDGPESIVVEEISRKILFGLSHNFSYVSEGLVGIESRVNEMTSRLGIGLDDVRFLGICGMGGIGKTTLAQVIYQRIADEFEASCFIPNVREETKRHGLLHLQKQVISQILGESETNLQINPCVATNMIASKIRQRRVLIILDDMDEDKQIEKLAGSHDWFGQGSRIIITCRDHHFLKKVPVDNTYEVKELNDTKALKLFSLKAFKEPHPEENYVELSKDIVSYSQGLPLALEIFGSSLFDRPIAAWKSARDLLKENPNAEILDKLKISYDGLEDLQQKMFLDIACFFNGAHIYDINYKLESFGYYPNINIRVLVDKSLITMSKRRLQMHDLLRKMGLKIVHYESPDEPGECSRLSCNEDVIHVLKNSTGTDAVRDIVLKLPLQKEERLNVEAFSKMKKLKMLEIKSYDSEEECDNLCTNLEWHGDPSNFTLSNELCVMQWWRYPLESLPTSFQSNKLVELIMRNSCIKQLWDGRKSFSKLTYIDLRHSQNLIETPDLSGVPNLRELVLYGCTSLSKVHPSIGLVTLEVLNLSSCSRLNKIPDSVGNLTSLQYLYLDGTAIKKIPPSFKRLSSLYYLNISNCSRLEKIPKNLLSGMKCLESLYAGGSATRKLRPDPIISLLLPNSLSSSSSLSHLDLSYCNLSNCSGLKKIPKNLLRGMKWLKWLCVGGSATRKLRPDPIKSLLLPNSLLSLSSLRSLDLSYCNLLDGAIPSDLSCLSPLWSLGLSGNKFTRIPDGVGQLPCLGVLDLSDCSSLQVLPKLPLVLRELRVRNCPSLELVYKQMDMWTTSNEKIRSIDCSAVQSHIDYDGKYFKILYLHPRSPLWSKERPGNFYPNMACGPASLVGSGIPEWFNDKSTNSFGTIQLHSDLGEDKIDQRVWSGYALFIVYEFHEPHTHPRKRRKVKVNELKGNSNSTTSYGSNSNFPIFGCQFKVDGVDVAEPLVLCAPGVPSVGPNGFWAYVPDMWFDYYELGDSLNGRRSLGTSITTGSLNIELKDCGARLVHDEDDASELYQLLNTISPRGWDLQNSENIRYRWPCLYVYGPIVINKSKVVVSGFPKGSSIDWDHA